MQEPVSPKEHIAAIDAFWKFDPDQNLPIRAELLGSERLIEQAKILALAHEAVRGSSPPTPALLKRFRQNSRFLHEAHDAVNRAIAEGDPIPPAEEWFVDNFHVIADQLSAIEEDLPKKFYLELPALGSGALQGYARTYEMALHMTAHTDSRLDLELLRDYIRSYQSVSPLTTGELWAIAILLRVGLMENLRRLIQVSNLERDARKDANNFAERLIQGKTSQEIEAVLQERKQYPKRVGGAFAVQLILRLRDEPPAHFLAVEWLYKQLSEAGLDADEMIRRKHHTIASDQVSVSNAIQSLRLLATTDWSDLVEEVSLVDAELRKDPSGYYSRCDFATRDRYRHAIEEIAKKSTKTEIEIAAEAVRLATDAKQNNPADRHQSHIGYYLIRPGRKLLEKLTGFRPGLQLAIRRVIRTRPFLFYQFPIVFLTVLFLLILLPYTEGFHLNLTFALYLLPASALAILVTNWLVAISLRPRILPKLELKEGIPQEYRTFIVLPCLLINRAEVRELVSRLEVTYLANSEDTLDFALLSDFVDADTPISPADESLLAEATGLIAGLNLKYQRSEGPRFHIYHRKRLWNESEQKWMGWERKRGKLEEFNRLLLGTQETSYLPAEVPANIRYVITLDADTLLPRDSARKLVGTIAHPLNSAVIDPVKKLVVEGYGILQPRVSHTLTSANRSWFSRIYSGHAGIDPYTTAVSDIYQDLFSEASYLGKGIYDLLAFSTATDPRFPENRLLSHDLIEGSFARTGLVSDIEIFDDHPSDYRPYILRLHRWVRGDWQVTPWMLPRVPGPDGSKRPNTLSWLNRWKIFDNLRRSLVSPALFLCLLFGWTVLPGSPIVWTVAVLAVIFASVLIQFISGVLTPPGKTRWLGRIWGLLYDAGFNSMQSLLQLAFLPNEAWVMTDAIVRTLRRMIRKKKMLEWTTAAQAEKSRGRQVQHYVSRMRGALLLTMGAALILFAAGNRDSILLALPFLLLWIMSPLIAFLVGKATPRKERFIPAAMVPAMRGYAREIWRFFETLVGDETHWLPPDNFQETPHPVVAPRTSPTNIGFLLLSNISAYDFGYIGAVEFIERTEKTLETLTQLKTFNGHLFNWYSTENLQPLEPRYVSTVDSGNLVAALMLVKQFTYRFGLNVQKSFEPRTGRYEGVRDTFGRFRMLAAEEVDFYEANKISLDRIEELLKVEPQDSSHQEQLLSELCQATEQLQQIVPVDPNEPKQTELEWWWNACKRVLETHLIDYERPQDAASRLLAISKDAEALTQESDFKFLFDEKRGVFSIGFNVTNGQLDRSYYDLFASEARLASFVAIAKGDVPQSHWFRMARAMTSFGRRRILLSWSGSMFEYLMPLLFLPNEPKTLMDISYRGAVDLQRMYGLERNVPWGISEAAYNARDLSQNYQYGPFGVPSLGLKRGLNRDLVVSPYATFLASLVRPRKAFKNLEHLKKMGAHGIFGFYESIDFSEDRVPKGERYSIVRTFMAHHQGMSLVALCNLLQKDIMQQRFASDPSAQATSLLLQEKMPLAVRSAPMHVVDERAETPRIAEPSVSREFRSPFVTPPRTQLLSNGNYLVMMTTGGGGYSQWNHIRLNRWREDVTRDAWGSFLYIRDTNTGEFWSAAFLPTLKKPDEYKVVFSEDQVEIRRRDGSLETFLEVSVSPEDNVEVRKVTIINSSDKPRDIEITTYSEVVLNTAAADAAHPAFSNLFVETQYLPENQTLVATRKPRGSDDKVYWSGQLLTYEDSTIKTIEFETDRAKFIGRNRNVIKPQALTSTQPLSGGVGAVLDPIFSLRCKIKIQPYTRQSLAAMTMFAESKEDLVWLADKYSNFRSVNRSKELASVHATVGLKQMSITKEDANLFQRIAGRLIYSDLSLRPRPSVLMRNSRTQSALWAYGISGDLPICLVRIEDETEIDMVRQVLHAHEYWRSKGFLVDLVILNEYPSSYFQELQDLLLALIRSTTSYQRMDAPGGVFLRRADLMPPEDQVLLRTVARVELSQQRGSLARQVGRVESKDLLAQRHVPSSQFPIIDPPLHIPVPPLTQNNGFGGFTQDGKEYVIALQGQSTPAPWINVIANSQFGFQVSESGAGATWCINSRENRLTQWSNDAVTDPMDTVIYIRDEESGQFWSATPQPAPAKGNYVVAHGIGYTRFHYGGYGIDHELLLYVAPDAPVKIMKLRLRNPSRRRRRLSVTCFMELALGVSREQSAHFVVTSIDSATGALLATNSFNNEFADRVAFLWMNDKKRTVSGDRTTFLGPSGTLGHPAAMEHAALSGKVGAGLDPCAAMRGEIQLNPLSEHTVIILFGQEADAGKARNLITSLNTQQAVGSAYDETYRYWDQIVSSIQVKTPDPVFDLMMNRWLLYQTYSCRFFSRSAFYQSGGAFGFRDQLQDAMAFVYSEPQIMRNHLLHCASRQFLEGDVQHWWHPPTGRGVRTRSSDDLLWLPYCTEFYIRSTGDTSVLDETVSYLEAPVLAPEEMEAYQVPVQSKVSATLYEHCLNAIDYSLKFGPHQLPLIGAGDWNDGMNRLGIHGKGESVWLAWFQIDILRKFTEIAQQRHDTHRSNSYRNTAEQLIQAVERYGWDGEWYRRGFDDEGVAFGSSSNHECKIDSIAQSWAVLSKAGDPERARKALKSVEELLIDETHRLALLFTPPFAHTERDPGYIKGYPTGIRENGGHYNHAATWLIAAFSELGMPERALEIFHLCAPVSRTANREAAEKYKVEPYAAVGDIYSHPAHKGRGGWSWYTGSAGWLYRTGLEWILGFRLNNNEFTVNPNLPASWDGYELTFRQGTVVHHIKVTGKDVMVTRTEENAELTAAS